MRPSQRRTRNAPGPVRPHRPTALAAALGAALLLAGCSSEEHGAAAGRAALTAAHEVRLQPLAAQGPDPFTPSTARGAGLRADRRPAAGALPAGAPGIREVTGSTPGLYGGTRAEASCDIEQQVALLAAEPPKNRAFAEAAGIPEDGVADWLRGLTPVLLRADTRVTNHGFRDGRADAFQSVLQAGTAVLVDPYGTPRVRCACGNPLRAPVSVAGAVHQGDPWDGFDPDRVIIVRPTTAVVPSLVIVNVADDSWIERKAGSDGDEDRKPATPPECDPAACVLDDPVTPDAGTAEPDAPATPGTRTPAPDRPTEHPVPPTPDGPSAPPVPDPPAPDAPADPYPSPDAPSGPADPFADPSAPRPDPYTEPGGGYPPPGEPLPVEPGPTGPDTFAG
ncbi:DUF6777 domain-containing protein [Streptomyces termitum]|uniref:DUF6777 domain-containing protein n=1 Tax=Streptomyces termitum TaxID=67368 RepID=UPI003787ACB9